MMDEQVDAGLKERSNGGNEAKDNDVVEYDADVSESEIKFEDIGEKELTDQERIQLYEKAMDFKLKRSYKHALLCFLGCIKGIQQDTKFVFLPNCLQNIASIYAKFEDFPKAVQFMQAAKLYFETALIGTQSKSDDIDEYKTMDNNAIEDDAKRANEYEKLSHDCLKDKNIQLALEYCGKATQLRRKVYGENNPVTVKSLDLFTMIYAEMGKLQYSEAIGKFDKLEFEKERISKKSITKEVRFADEISSKREDNVDESSKDDVQGEEEEAFGIQHEDDAERNVSSNRLITSRQFLIIFILSVLFAVILTLIWCTYSENKGCPSFGYMYERTKFYYYFYVKSLLTEQNYI